MAYHSLTGGEVNNNVNDTDDSDIPNSSLPYYPTSTIQPSSFSINDTQYERLDGHLRGNQHDLVEDMIKSMISTKGSYQVLDDDDDEYEAREGDNQGHNISVPSSGTTHPEDHLPPSDDPFDSVKMPKPLYQDNMVRTVSREGSMRHPTPDLQSLQGAYVGNVERLELSAERLSMGSDIGEEVRKIRMEQKRSESRKSSLAARSEGGITKSSVSRQFSSSSNASHSILGVNSVARSGGFSPAGYYTSPIGSLRSPSWSHNSIQERSISQGERLMTQISEPEQEGRPLDSPISVRSVPLIQPPQPPPHAYGTTGQARDSSPPEHYENIDEARLGSPIDLAPSYGLVDDQHQNPNDFPDRPATAASTDTYQKANSLFADFDGVHVTSHKQFSTIGEDESSRHVSGVQPPIMNQSQASTELPLKENMIYYPAPVPMMLNLPQRLSKLPAIQRDKRRSQMLGTMPSAARKSAAWLPDVLEDNSDDLDTNPMGKASKPTNVRQSTADLPPQLRASMFFDHPSIPQNVEIKGSSAVATLDSILDASAFAPVNAFTDHPIAGHVGAAIFGRSPPKHGTAGLPHQQAVNRQSKISINSLKQRHSSATLQTIGQRNSSFMSIGRLVGERESSAPQLAQEDTHDHRNATRLSSERASFLHPTDDDEQKSSQDDSDDEEEFLDAQEDFDGEAQIQDEDGYDGPPTTLLAELQLRKQQQKQRNRTAATAFPYGMHSTLLQLDAVAQVEKQSRKQKHVTLAWEDPNVRPPGIENEDDEDVPLGMLFPRRDTSERELAGRHDENRPIGLIARRTIEDNEPLSQRRARLKDEPSVRVPSPNKRPNTLKLDLPGVTGVDANGSTPEDGETLGQRLKRLKGISNGSNAQTISGDFASEVLNHFGGDPEPNKSVKNTHEQAKDPEEETLGQRRKRLQAEREVRSREVSEEHTSASCPPIKQRSSMVNILPAHPTTGSRSVSQEKTPPIIESGRTGYEPLGVSQRFDDRIKINPSHVPNIDPTRKTLYNTNLGTSPGPVLMTSGIGASGLSEYSNRFTNGFAQNSAMSNPYGKAMQYANPMAFRERSVAANGFQGTAPDGSTILLPARQDEPHINFKHRDIIDRWRQSVNY